MKWMRKGVIAIQYRNTIMLIVQHTPCQIAILAFCGLIFLMEDVPIGQYDQRIAEFWAHDNIPTFKRAVDFQEYIIKPAFELENIKIVIAFTFC